MANQIPDFTPPPLTIADLLDDSYILPPNDYTLQLQVDTLNVVEGRLPLSTFSKERQEQIQNYYRFSADNFNQRSPNKVAKRTLDTLDII